MDAMQDIKRMLKNELDTVAKQGKLTQGTLDSIDKITHAIKSIDTIKAMEESGYSNRGSYEMSYDGRSYARDRRGRNQDGSYRMRNDGGRDQRYSYGYSRDIKEGLEDLMEYATPHEKMAIERVMRELDD